MRTISLYRHRPGSRPVTMLLILALVAAPLAALFTPRPVQAYGYRAHQYVASEALRLFSTPELMQYKANILLGADKEDEERVFPNLNAPEPTLYHFWDADDGVSSQNCFVDCYLNAYVKGIMFWDLIIQEYNAGQKEQAFDHLGHLAHLLTDMSAPAHAHGDYHPFNEAYEDWVGANPQILIDGALAQVAAGRGGLVGFPWTFEGIVPEGVNGTDAEYTNLFYLFYMTNQYGDYFDSDDVDGDYEDGWGVIDYGLFPPPGAAASTVWDWNASYAVRTVATLYKIMLARVDQAPPTMTFYDPVVPPSGWFNTDVQIPYTFSDYMNPANPAMGYGTGVKTFTRWWDGEEPITWDNIPPNVLMPPIFLTNENGSTLHYRLVDYAGNVSEGSRQYILPFDKTPPTIQITTPVASTYNTAQDFKINFSYQDARSGSAGAAAKLDGVPVTNGQLIDLVPPAGPRTLVVQVMDKAGNVGEKTVQFNVEVLPPDTRIFPQGQSGSSGWYTAPVKIELVPSDHSGKGIQKTEYQYNRGVWQVYSGAFSLSQEGKTVVGCRSIDKDGVTGPTVEQTINIDTRPPVIAIHLQKQYTNKMVLQNIFELNDPYPGSGLSWYTAWLGSTDISSGQPVSLKYFTPGTYSVSVAAIDVAGHSSHQAQTFEVVENFAVYAPFVRK